jgi:hypothetical protein
MKSVVLTNCFDLIDISPLYKVPRVFLYACPRVTDVSALCAASEVVLYMCNGIRCGEDKLGAVKKLAICHDQLNRESPRNVYRG